MKRYHKFYYKVEGVLSFRLMSVLFSTGDISDDEAHKIAVKMLKKEWPGKKIKVYANVMNEKQKFNIQK